VAEKVARIRLAVGIVAEVAVATANHTEKSLKIIFGAFGEPEAGEGIGMNFEVVADEGPEQVAEETPDSGKSLQGLTVLELVVQGYLVKRRLGGQCPWVRLVAPVLSSLM
jgi:hypothetical protein